MTKKQTKIITILSVVAFILAILVTRNYWLRLDLTKNKAYTISQVSRNIHRELPDPVTITYYLSNRLKTVVPAPGEIEDMLREYAAHSRGKIRFFVRDPVRAGVAAEEFGLQPRQLPIIEQDQTSLITVYSGIVIEYLDRIDVLPWVISTDTLEYDLTSRIRSLVSDTERWIGVIIGDQFRHWAEDFSFLNHSLAEAGYRVRLISPGDEIPENTPGLFVLGGSEGLDEWALYRIDRYIQMGGKVMFAVKSVFIDTIHGTIEARHQNDLGLLEMIAYYGVTILPELTLDRNALTLQYQTRLPNGMVQIRLVRYPLWISVPGDFGNAEHPVSSGFNGIDLYWANPLLLHPDPDVEAAVLFTSSPHAWSMRSSFHTNPEILYLMEMEAEETTGTKILGASLSGVIPSFFRGYDKPVREGSDEELPDLPDTARPSRIIVVGETDFATNMINATQAGQNLEFLRRAADWLVSDDDIIGIRNRQPQTGRFDRVSDPDMRSALMRLSQIINVGLIPLLVIIIGIVRATRRSRKMRVQVADNSNLELKTEKEPEQINESEKENSDDV